MLVINMFVIKCLILLFLSLTPEAGKILVVVPTPSISHQVVFRPLTQELARRGHEVVVMTADPAFPKGKTPANLTEIDFHDVSYSAWRKGSMEAAVSGNSKDLTNQWQVLLKLMGEVFKIQIRTDEVKRFISDNSNHFDLVIVEACVKPAMALAHVFKAPLILVSSIAGFQHQYDLFGAPSRPTLHYPVFYRQRLNNLTIMEKLNELYNYYYIEKAFDDYQVVYDRIVKELFGPDTPTMKELDKQVDMLFLNVHPIWDSNRPVPPNIIYMGGVHQSPSKELPKDLKSYLDSSKHGVIYISYGTNVRPSQLPPEKIQVLVKTFSQLPYDVLWKWDNDELPGRSDNIKLSKWLPQSDLLKHPNVKLFITQGGLQSTDEAITAGIPLIGMPMLGDQWFNVEQYVLHKIGLRVDMETITEHKFKTAIETVMKDDSYRKNMEKLRSIMRDQPQSPLERAVWWTEHIMRHGGAPHLRAKVAHMSWSEYLDVELLAVIAGSALIALIAISVAAYLIVGFMKRILSGIKGKTKIS